MWKRKILPYPNKHILPFNDNAAEHLIRQHHFQLHLHDKRSVHPKYSSAEQRHRPNKLDRQHDCSQQIASGD